MPGAAPEFRRPARIAGSAAPLRIAAACVLAFAGTSLLVMETAVRAAMEADIRQPDFGPEQNRDLIDGVFLVRFGGPGTLFLAAAAACVLLTVFHARSPSRLNWLGWPVWGAAALGSCYFTLGNTPELGILVSSTYDMVVLHVDRREGLAGLWRLVGSSALWILFPAACLCQLWRRPTPRYSLPVDPFSRLIRAYTADWAREPEESAL